MKTQLTDSELRASYAALLRTRPPTPAGSAVPLDRILALVERRGTEAERVATLDAVMADSASRRDFELLRSIAANMPVGAARRRVSRTIVPLAAAAAVIVAAVFIARREITSRGPEPLRAAVQNAVLTDPPIEATPAQSRTFRWRAVAGARRYALEILTATGTPVFTTHAPEPAVTLPADVVLTAGVEYRWWVATEFSDGTQRRSAFRRLIVNDTR